MSKPRSWVTKVHANNFWFFWWVNQGKRESTGRTTVSLASLSLSFTESGCYLVLLSPAPSSLPSFPSCCSGWCCITALFLSLTLFFSPRFTQPSSCSPGSISALCASVTGSFAFFNETCVCVVCVCLNLPLSFRAVSSLLVSLFSLHLHFASLTHRHTFHWRQRTKGTRSSLCVV